MKSMSPGSPLTSSSRACVACAGAADPGQPKTRRQGAAHSSPCSSAHVHAQPCQVTVGHAVAIGQTVVPAVGEGQGLAARDHPAREGEQIGIGVRPIEPGVRCPGSRRCCCRPAVWPSSSPAHSIGACPARARSGSSARISAAQRVHRRRHRRWPLDAAVPVRLSPCRRGCPPLASLFAQVVADQVGERETVVCDHELPTRPARAAGWKMSDEPARRCTNSPRCQSPSTQNARTVSRKRSFHSSQPPGNGQLVAAGRRPRARRSSSGAPAAPDPGQREEERRLRSKPWSARARAPAPGRSGSPTRICRPSAQRLSSTICSTRAGAGQRCCRSRCVHATAQVGRSVRR